MLNQIRITVLLLLPNCLLSQPCPYGLIQSAWDESCVETSVVLLGGRNLNGWRADGEIWVNDMKMDVKLPDFPYAIDAPFGWWSSRGLLVCGGRNWDVDVPESRCWRYDQCSGSWQEETGEIFSLIPSFYHELIKAS